MKEDNNKDMKFWIHPDDFNKVIQYAESSYRQFKSEIGGQMVCIPDKDGDFILKAPVILKQDVSGGDCTMETEALALHYAQMAIKYGKNVRNCWWHSHHNMKAFWSGTDDATILDTPSRDWTVSLVVNLKREYKLRIQFFQPFLHEENIILNFLTEKLKVNKVIDKEVTKLCDNRSQVHAYNTYNQSIKTHQLALGNYNNTYMDRYDQTSYNNSFGILDNANNQEVSINHLDTRQQQYITNFIEALTDSIDTVFPADLEIKDLKKYNNRVNIFNKNIKSLNLKIKTFKDTSTLENALLQWWPEQYLEHIKKS